MAIIAHCVAQNYGAGNYHRINRTEVICGPFEPNPRFVHHVGHYFSEAARDDPNSEPMWTNRVVVTFAEIVASGRPDPRDMWYADVMASSKFAPLDPVSDEAPPPP